MRNVKAGERYRHFKGGIYEIVGVARHSEDPTQEFIVYRSVDHKESTEDLWIRPKTMFLEKIEHTSSQQYRFEKIKKGGKN